MALRYLKCMLSKIFLFYSTRHHHTFPELKLTMHDYIAGGPQALQPVEAMLAVASHPANEIAEMSYTFWYRLSRNLTSSFVSAQHAPNQQV